MFVVYGSSENSGSSLASKDLNGYGMSQTKNPLQKVRENQRFVNGLSYVYRAAGGIKKINSGELMHLNQILTETDEPWRFEPAEIEIPGGKKQLFNLVSNPVAKARELIGNALQTAGNGEVEKAAVELYRELVLAHLFRDANRRTAVLATVWILENHGIKVDAESLANIPVGDLRTESERRIFENRVSELINAGK